MAGAQGGLGQALLAAPSHDNSKQPLHTNPTNKLPSQVVGMLAGLAKPPYLVTAQSDPGEGMDIAAPSPGRHRRREMPGWSRNCGGRRLDTSRWTSPDNPWTCDKARHRIPPSTEGESTVKLQTKGRIGCQPALATTQSSPLGPRRLPGAEPSGPGRASSGRGQSWV